LEPGGLIVLVALFAMFWLLIIKPQRRRLQDQRDLHASIAVGNEILTNGGLIGHVREIVDDDDVLLVEIAPGTTVRVVRRGVAAVLSPKEEGS
jgi:preprotein translocase subunit YajC